MKKIILNTFDYKGQKHIGLVFDHDKSLQELLKSHFSELSWSSTFKIWHLPFSNQFVSSLFNVVKGKVWLDYSALKTEKVEMQEQSKGQQKPSVIDLAPANPSVKNTIDLFERYLQSKRYSANTVKTYCDALRIFLRYYQNKNTEEISNDDLILFNNDYILAKGYSSSYQNQFVNAIKLYFDKIRDKQLKPELIHRPKAERKLPNVLSKEEVKTLLESLQNSKHKTMLSLIYACGLRRGELLRIKPQDILSDRKLLHIKQSKGKKDRIVPISDKLLEMLREYYKSYKPKVWLFEGQHAGEPYSEKSLESIIKQAIAKTNIQKPVTLHWLRHSYATHLLESGTDLRYIQELLGHNSSRTTEIYTHVSRKSIQQIKSPFDDL